MDRATLDRIMDILEAHAHELPADADERQLIAWIIRTLKRNGYDFKQLFSNLKGE